MIIVNYGLQCVRRRALCSLPFALGTPFSEKAFLADHSRRLFSSPPSRSYHNESEFSAHMTPMFAQLEAFARRPGKAALFRETSAQHFEGTGAYAGKAQSHLTKGSTCVCAPMSLEVAANNVATRQNRVVAELAERSAAVRILPFYELTLPRHDMHEAEYCAFEQRRGKRPEEMTYVCCECVPHRSFWAFPPSSPPFFGGKRV